MHKTYNTNNALKWDIIKYNQIHYHIRWPAMFTKQKLIFIQITNTEYVQITHHKNFPRHLQEGIQDSEWKLWEMDSS